MQPRILGAIGGLAAFSMLWAGSPAAAQVSSPIGSGGSGAGGGPYYSQPAPPRIEVNPRPVYRRCASWYVLQYRPSGTVLFPEKHCWWQRW